MARCKEWCAGSCTICDTDQYLCTDTKETPKSELRPPEDDK